MNKENWRSRAFALTLSACMAMLATACGGGSTGTAPTGETRTGGGEAGDSILTGGPTADPVPTPAPSPAQAPATGEDIAMPSESTCGLAGFASEMLALINQARSAGRACGATQYPAAAPLAWNAQLFSAAERHSRDMASNDFFSHTGSDGGSFSQRISASGYVYRSAAENIAAGQRSVAEAVQGWLQSPGHCANIMNGQLTEVAVSCVRSSARYGTYWTMDLGRPM